MAWSTCIRDWGNIGIIKSYDKEEKIRSQEFTRILEATELSKGYVNAKDWNTSALQISAGIRVNRSSSERTFQNTVYDILRDRYVSITFNKKGRKLLGDEIEKKMTLSAGDFRCQRGHPPNVPK